MQIPTSPASTPTRRLPQRAVVAGPAGSDLEALASRLADLLDVPSLHRDDLPGPADEERVATFDGWVVTGSTTPAPALLERADLVVLVLPEEPGALRGLVRRTVRRMRSETVDFDPSWFDALVAAHPEVDAHRLVGPAAQAAWLSALA